jgi:hypothetical protein
MTALRRENALRSGFVPSALAKYRENSPPIINPPGSPVTKFRAELTGRKT